MRLGAEHSVHRAMARHRRLQQPCVGKTGRGDCLPGHGGAVELFIPEAGGIEAALVRNGHSSGHVGCEEGPGEDGQYGELGTGGETGAW